MHEFAFSTNAFTGSCLSSAIESIAFAGYKGVEIMADRPHAWLPDLRPSDLDVIKAALARTGLKVSNVNAFMMRAVGDMHHPSWIEPDPQKRRQRLEHTLLSIDFAHEVGAPSISTEPGGPVNGRKLKKYLDVFRDGLLPLEEKALEKNVKVLIEPEPGLLIETGDEFLSFFEGLNRDAFGLNFDIGHFFCTGADCANEIKRLAPYTDHFHLEDIGPERRHFHLIPGQGAIDFRKVLDSIAESGFDGFITIELYANSRDPDGAARRALEYLGTISPKQGPGIS